MMRMSEPVTRNAFDGDLFTKLQAIDFSTAPQEVVTIEQALYHYEQDELKRYMMESLETKKKLLYTWLGADCTDWTTQRVLEVYSREYQRRIQLYRDTHFY